MPPSGGMYEHRAFMVIPDSAVVTGLFGASHCSARRAADGRPHSELVESLNLIDVAPPARICQGLSMIAGFSTVPDPQVTTAYYAAPL